MHATSSDEARATSNQRSIPTVDTDTPGKVVMSIRAAGVTVATYLNSSAALVRAGRGGGSLQQEVQDTVVTLFDTSAREIEVCSEMDVNRGKVGRKGGTEDGMGILESLEVVLFFWLGRASEA